MTLWVVMLGIALSLGLAFQSARGAERNDPRAFFAARGQFGAILFFLISVGETYSIGSLLGFPGGIAATHSVDVALWFVGYILLACPVGYVLYPRLWEAGQRAGAVTLADLLGRGLGSIMLERVTACMLVVLMVPLGAMQFIGLDAVVSRLLTGLPGLPVAMISAGLAFMFVALAGLRAAARISLLKDGLIVVAILSVAVAAFESWPTHPAGPLSDVFRDPATGKGSGALFVLSTIVVQSLGFCIAPQTVTAAFAARSPAVIRRAQIWLPLYMMLFPLLCTIAVFGMMNRATYHAGDQIFLAVAAQLLPDWGLGLVYCAVILTALVWLGAMGLSLSALVTRNILPAIPSHRQRHVGLVVILLYFGCSAMMASRPHTLIVTLNQFFYLGLVQLLPAVLACVGVFAVRNHAVLAGIVAGLGTGLGLSLSGWPLGAWSPGGLAVGGVNPAFVALMVNLGVAGLWTAISGRFTTR